MRRVGINYFLPFNDVFSNFAEINAYCQKFLKQNLDKNTFIPPAPIVFPISLVGKIPLKDEYWDGPTDDLTNTERINNFLKPLQYYHFQKLLVIPLRNGKETMLKAAYCFNIQAKEIEIAFFLSNNYLAMDERVRFAALYHFENPFRFELEGGKRVKIQDISTPIKHD